MRYATGAWLVLSARGIEPDHIAGRYRERGEAEELAANLCADGEDARVVPEYAYDGIYDE